jgi:hypothetical protein
LAVISASSPKGGWGTALARSEIGTLKFVRQLQDFQGIV